jgi:hypothetical protein
MMKAISTASRKPPGTAQRRRLAPPCPVVALQTWLKLGGIAHGPLFWRIAGDGKEAGPDRLTDKHVARLVKRTALAAGVRGDLSEAERRQKFSGHSLHAGLATAAQANGQRRDGRGAISGLGIEGPSQLGQSHREKPSSSRAMLVKYVNMNIFDIRCYQWQGPVLTKAAGL